MKKILIFISIVLVISTTYVEGQNFSWAVKAGGKSSDKAKGIVKDDGNNLYITGYFSDTAYFGTTQLISHGQTYGQPAHEIFIAKMDPLGNFLWAKSAGGLGDDEGNDIAIDADNNIIITGIFSDTAYFGLDTLRYNKSIGNDIFITKMDKDGNWLWAKQVSATTNSTLNYGNGVSTDGNKNIYVTGQIDGTVSFGNISLTTNGPGDIFVAKLDPSGNFVWAKEAGGAMGGDADCGKDIATDNDGNSYITGNFMGIAANPASFGTIHLTATGAADLFVAKIDKDGNWQWAKSAGGTDQVSYTIGYNIAIDSQGNSYVQGLLQTSSNGTDTTYTASFGSNTISFYRMLSSSDVADYLCVAKLDANGTNWLWAKGAGTVNTSKTNNVHQHMPGGICLDSQENCYITGTFPCNPYYYNHASFGSTNLSAGNLSSYIAEINTSGVWQGATLVSAGYFITNGAAIIQNNGYCFVAGCFAATATFGSINLTSNNYSYDVYVTKVSINGGSGINTNPEESGLVYIYPNPANDNITIESSIIIPKEIISIYNIQGKLLMEQPLLQTKTEINISNLSSGLYIVKINDNKSVMVKRIVKE